MKERPPYNTPIRQQGSLNCALLDAECVCMLPTPGPKPAPIQSVSPCFTHKIFMNGLVKGCAEFMSYLVLTHISVPERYTKEEKHVYFFFLGKRARVALSILSAFLLTSSSSSVSSGPHWAIRLGRPCPPHPSSPQSFSPPHLYSCPSVKSTSHKY